MARTNADCISLLFSGFVCATEKVFDLLYAATPSAKMDNSVAIRAHGYEMFDWVHLILDADPRQWLDMMDVDETIRKRTVNGSEIKTTDLATGSVMFDAPGSRCRITLVCVDPDLPNRTLHQALGRR